VAETPRISANCGAGPLTQVNAFLNRFLAPPSEPYGPTPSTAIGHLRRHELGSGQLRRDLFRHEMVTLAARFLGHRHDGDRSREPLSPVPGKLWHRPRGARSPGGAALLTL
jgi:hypothetical protein